jgi:hypothetical protein
MAQIHNLPEFNRAIIIASFALGSSPVAPPPTVVGAA